MTSSCRERSRCDVGLSGLFVFYQSSMVRVGYWGGRRVGGERRADTHQEGATTDIVGGPLNEPEAGHRQLSHLNLREGKVQYISGCSLSLAACYPT